MQCRLVISDINGTFEKAFTHVQKLHEKAGPFQMLFCVGRFYGATGAAALEPFQKGEKTVPIPTYFITTPEEESLLPKEVLVEGGPVGHNLIYLGRVGCKDINGFLVAYISTTTVSEEPQKMGVAPSTSQTAEIEAALGRVYQSPGFAGVDFLLSNHWPRSILTELGDNTGPIGVSVLEYDKFGSELVRKVAVDLAPRYHFATTPSHIHYERPPFIARLNSKTILHVTRFVSLAEAFNDRKAKFVYAFSTQPLKAMPLEELTAQPPNTTMNPFTSLAPGRTQSNTNDSKKRSFEEMERESNMQTGSHLYQQVSRVPTGHQNKRQKRGEDDRRQHDQQHPPKKTFEEHPLMKRMAGCWFCLSNPEVEKHLIASIGDESYVTLAKGGVTDYHSLIIPIVHAPSSIALEEATRNEMERYKKALTQCMEANDQSVIFFEQYLPTKQNVIHMQIQAVPVPRDVATRAQKMFEDVAKELDMELAMLDEGETLKQVASNRFYIYIELPGNVKLIHLVNLEGKRVPFQFGRRVIARLIGAPEKEDWKQCVPPQNVEVQNCKSLKEKFKRYDFTLA